MPTLKPSEPVIRLPDVKPIPIFFHTDADGCCSAALVADWLERNGTEFTLNPKDVGTVNGVETGIYLDLASISPDKVTKDTIVIDHHPGPELPCQYFNPRNRGESWPTCKECFRLVGRKQIVWMAAVGCVGDGQPDAEFNNLTQKLYGQVNLMRFADLIDAHRSVRDLNAAKQTVELLLKFRESPSEFLKQEPLLESWSKVESEINRVMAQEPKKIDKLLIVRFKSELRIKSQVANNLKDKYPENIILVVHEKDSTYRISLRQVKQMIDFSEILPRITSDLKGSAGGHPVAAGGKILKSDYDEFVRRLVHEIG